MDIHLLKSVFEQSVLAFVGCGILVIYPGRNYFAAHSLGNMLVSSAIQDWRMPYEKYFLINAAVATEAYDPAAATGEAKNRMTPADWRDLDDSVKASHWYEHPGFATNDARRALTWRGRFSSVTNTVNYYSSEEEVLKCGHGEDHFPVQRDWAWYNQERYKGDMIAGGGRNEGGWKFSRRYMVEDERESQNPDYPGIQMRPPNSQEVSLITDDLREHPLFLPFEDGSLHTTNFVGTISRDMISQLLADAIPAESLPAGFSRIACWDALAADQGDAVGPIDVANVDMSSECKDSRANDIYFWSSDRKWIHSFFLSAPYVVVHGLYESISNHLEGGAL